jgi:hypothetical protein
VKTSVCRFKSQPYYRHLAAFRLEVEIAEAFRRRQLSTLQTMELPLDGDKYDSLLIFTVTDFFWDCSDSERTCAYAVYAW